jgi:RNA polymerase sigma-70 factor (ECF subfamily)
MFRITCTQHPSPTLVTEGDLVGLYVDELRGVAASLLEAGRPWTLDLSGVGFADSTGVALLVELGSAGVELIGDSAFLRELLLRARPATANPSAAEAALSSTDERRRDQDLIAALRRGCGGAREELVRRFGPGMLAVSRRFLVSDDEAGLALRDAFWAALEGLESFPEGARITTWLHGIVVREAMRRLLERVMRSEEEAALESLLPRFTKNGQRVLDEADDALGIDGPGAHLETLTPEMEAAVRSCIDRLPGTQRAVLLLCDVEGLGVAEAASLLGVDLGEAKRRLHRSRQALRLLLGRSLGSTRSWSPAPQPIPA